MNNCTTGNVLVERFLFLLTLIINRWGRDEWNEYLKDFDVLGMTPEVLTLFVYETMSAKMLP